MNIRNILSLTKREMLCYFFSPVVYVFIIIFLVMLSFFTFMWGAAFFEYGQASLILFFQWHPWLFLILVPAIGMNLWSDERRLGTIELMFTMPITVSQAVISKFLASWLIVGLALILTFPIVITVNILGDPDNMVIVAGYIGSFLLAGAYLAVTSMTSAMTKSQVISFILSVVICLLLLIAGFPPVTNIFVEWAPVWLLDTVASFSVYPHFINLQRGIIDSRDIIYYLSVIVFSLFMTGIILKNHRAG